MGTFHLSDFRHAPGAEIHVPLANVAINSAMSLEALGAILVGYVERESVASSEIGPSHAIAKSYDALTHAAKGAFPDPLHTT